MHTRSLLAICCLLFYKQNSRGDKSQASEERGAMISSVVVQHKSARSWVSRARYKSGSLWNQRPSAESSDRLERGSENDLIDEIKAPL
jgi:hypothetical protein